MAPPVARGMIELGDAGSLSSADANKAEALDGAANVFKTVPAETVAETAAEASATGGALSFPAHSWSLFNRKS